jgi:hypothetical protein
MEYNQLIHEFLEGTLDKAGEAQLFLGLSTSDELRNELKQAISLDKAFNKRISAFVPTSASTIGIFQQLGIGTAAGIAGAALAGKSAFASFFSTYSQAIISGLATLAVTTGLFLGLHTLEKNQDNQSVAQSNQIVKSESSSLNNNNSVPNIMSNEVVPPRVRTIIKYVYLTDNSNQIIEKEALIASNKDITIVPHFASFSNFNYPTLPAQINSDNNSSNLNSLDQPIYNSFTDNIRIKSDLGLSFEIKGNGSWSLPSSTLPIYSNQLLNNTSLILNYKVSDNLKLGMDIRQENFYQVYKGTNEVNEKFEYRQNPTYLSFSLSGRYTFLRSNGFEGIVQGQVGGTATGLVTRAMIGLQYSPYKDIFFVLGGEAGVLTYTHQNNIFNSNKIGIIYGLGFNF